MESEKGLTRDFRETVKERAARDPEYLGELLNEANRLRALVRDAYAEGFREGLNLFPSPADYAWDRSTSKRELDNK